MSTALEVGLVLGAFLFPALLVVVCVRYFDPAEFDRMDADDKLGLLIGGAIATPIVVLLSLFWLVAAISLAMIGDRTLLRQASAAYRSMRERRAAYFREAGDVALERELADTRRLLGDEA